MGPQMTWNLSYNIQLDMQLIVYSEKDYNLSMHVHYLFVDICLVCIVCTYHRGRGGLGML